MYRHKILFLALCGTLAFTSCKKSEAYEATQSHEALAAPTAATAWKTVNDWKTSEQEQFRIQYGTLSDSTLTAEVVNKGLVLVYAKEGNKIQSLPFQSQESNAFWYYQVAEGSLLVSSDRYENATVAAPEVRYFVFTEQQLNELEKAGHSREGLMSLSYEQASALAAK